MSELVEVDPATGEESLVATGTMRQMERAMVNSMRNAQDEFDTYGEEWPWYRVQPVTA